MASRILGMGDIVGLVEEAQKNVDHKEAKKLAEKVKSGKSFDLDDFKAQISQMKTDLTSQITPPSAASSAGGVSPLGTNPIVNPNPATQALAQALQGKI